MRIAFLGTIGVTIFFSFFFLIFVSVALMVSTVPAMAGDTGLAQALHTIKKEGKKSCIDGHVHYGTSKAQRSKKLALKAAKRAWMSFTAFEYGSDWASFRNAATKGKACTKARDDRYGCNVSARPCRVNGKTRRRRDRR